VYIADTADGKTGYRPSAEVCGCLMTTADADNISADAKNDTFIGFMSACVQTYIQSVCGRIYSIVATQQLAILIPRKSHSQVSTGQSLNSIKTEFGPSIYQLWCTPSAP